MQVEDLSSLDANTTLDTDIVIIGGGPAGLTIAREFFGTSTRVLILESGQLEGHLEKYAPYGLMTGIRVRSAGIVRSLALIEAA